MTIKVTYDLSGASPPSSRYTAFHEESHDYTSPYGTGATELEALEEYRWEIAGRKDWEDLLDEVDAAIAAARLAMGRRT